MNSEQKACGIVIFLIFFVLSMFSVLVTSQLYLHRGSELSLLVTVISFMALMIIAFVIPEKD